MISITITQEDLPAQRFDFGSEQQAISIGRRAGNDLRISCRSVSGEHARLEITDGTLWIEDLESTNGTYVNGRLVNRHRLRNGDDVVMGRARLAVEFELPEGITDREKTDELPAGEEVAETAEDSARLSSELEPYARRLAARHEHADTDVATEVAAPRRRHADREAAEPEESGPVAAGEEQPVRRDDAASELTVDDTREPAPAAPVLPASTEQSRPTEAAGSTSESDASVALAADAARPAPADPPHALQAAHEALLDESDAATAQLGRATIEIINGAKSGQTLPIDKPVTTLGRPGIQIAAIMRKPNGYFLMHVESDDHVGRPTLNDDEIGDEPVLLHSGDELQVAGVEVQFNLS